MMWLLIKSISTCTKALQNNDEGPITKLWRGSLRLFAYIHIYTYTHIHILTYTYIYMRYIYYMQCIPIDYFGPLSIAWQETPPPNPGGPESHEIRRVCWSYHPKIWQATRQSCCRDVHPISERLEKSKAGISQPRTPQNPAGGQPPS